LTMTVTPSNVEEKAQARPRRAVRELIRTNEFALLMVLIVGCVIVTLINRNFMALSNIGTLGRDIAIIGILGVGEAFVILLGGIDLSVGSVYGLAGVIVAFFCVVPDPTQQVATLGLPIPVAVV